MHLVQELDARNGLFVFNLPFVLFPDLSGKDLEPVPTTIDFTVLTDAEITELCHPENCKVDCVNPKHVVIKLEEASLGNLVVVSKSKDDATSPSFKIMFRTANMEKPRLLFQKNQKPDGYVSVMAQFMPTFQEEQPQDKETAIALTLDPNEFEDMPMDMNFELNRVKDLKKQFIFVIDRSHSMEDYGRIHIAIKALKLFMQSLPAGCGFQIISFGTRHHFFDDRKAMIPYNDNSLQWAKRTIDEFDVLLGGTEMHKPLSQLFRLRSKEKF